MRRYKVLATWSYSLAAQRRWRHHGDSLTDVFDHSYYVNRSCVGNAASEREET